MERAHSEAYGFKLGTLAVLLTLVAQLQPLQAEEQVGAGGAQDNNGDIEVICQSCVEEEAQTTGAAQVISAQDLFTARLMKIIGKRARTVLDTERVQALDQASGDLGSNVQATGVLAGNFDLAGGTKGSAAETLSALKPRAQNGTASGKERFSLIGDCLGVRAGQIGLSLQCGGIVSTQLEGEESRPSGSSVQIVGGLTFTIGF